MNSSTEQLYAILNYRRAWRRTSWRKRKQTIIDKMASEGPPLSVIIQEAARIWP